MSVLGNDQLMMTDDGYNIQRSLRFRSSASAYLNRTPSAGNQTIWTWSAWVKRGKLGVFQRVFGAGPVTTNETGIDITANDQIQVYQWISTAFTFNVITAPVLRDPSAWYHIVVSYDSTQATAANRIRIYINGVQVTSFASSSYPLLNYSAGVNSAVVHQIGFTSGGGATDYFDGYLAELNFTDGYSPQASSFGQTDAVTGVWTPKKYTGTYGTNGFYLPFTDNSSSTTLGYDKSGNSNNWTANNISTTAGVTYDSMTDVPTLTSATAANFCTLNPLALRRDVSTTVTFADGNLKATFNNAGGNTTHAWGTQGITSGSFYWEITINAAPTNVAIGIGDYADQDGTANHSVIYINTGVIAKYGTTQTTAASYTTNDVIGVAYDATAGTIAFYKNNTLQYTVTGLTYTPSLPFNRGTTSDSIIANFGQRPFSYTPPTGFKALNTFNLPDPTIKKPNQYMDATTYTGNGATSRSIANASAFQPDLVWVKCRSDAGQSHNIVDSVRGVGTNVMNTLYSNSTDGEQSINTNPSLGPYYGAIGGITSSGFTVTAGSTGIADQVNKTNSTYVGWQWKESATAGFDIVTYTGTGSATTVAHSLGVAPKMIILKKRSSATASNWVIGHTSNGWAGQMYFDTGAYSANSGSFNSTAPTSSVFSIGTDSTVNASTQTYVAYLFAEIAGFSKFGSYTGNGSADGPFVYCGFRPKYVMIKNATRSTSYTSWQLIDTSREPYNIGSGTVPSLWANNSNAEGTRGASGSGTDSVNYMDVLSNGFKIRSAASDETNDNTQTFIFAAFAETPFKTALAR